LQDALEIRYGLWYTMNMTKAQIDPRQHDEATAALYFELEQAHQTLEQTKQKIIHAAGPKEILQGAESKRGWGREEVYYDLETALQRCDSAMLIDHYTKDLAQINFLYEDIRDAEAQYTGWSRFFLVTSSTGHIHSSMHCDTCYDSTTYGWLPELSGLLEAHAVMAHGEVLCTRCFPNAPTGDTISVAKAATLAWSPDRDEKRAKAEAAHEAKAAAKIKKAASKLKYDESLAHKVNALFDLDVPDVYRWTWDHKGYDNAYFVYSDIGRRAACAS
jgi:hypothetical protein